MPASWASAGAGWASAGLGTFPGRGKPEASGRGPAPALIPVGIAPELAHTVRYTSPRSASDMRRLVADQGGHYDYWATGRRAALARLAGQRRPRGPPRA